jgi:hypothetical protein
MAFVVLGFGVYRLIRRAGDGADPGGLANALSALSALTVLLAVGGVILVVQSNLRR